MYLLAFEDKLRAEQGLPPVTLRGPKSACLWKGKPAGPANAAAAVRSGPAKLCKDFRLEGGRALELVDELFAHAEFAGARDLALFIAAAPNWALPQKRFETQVFFWLKAIQAATEGGFYDHARALLLQVETVIPSLSSSLSQTLLQANVKVLWGRLLQLLELKEGATGSLNEASALFPVNMTPPDWELLCFRSGVDAEPPRELQDSMIHRASDDGRYLYGGLAEAYRRSLLGRHAERHKKWENAAGAYEDALNALAHEAHADVPDPIRTAYATLGRGYAIAKAELVHGSDAEVERGLRLLLEARWSFQAHAFAPGEYAAYHRYVHVRIDHEQLEPPQTVHYFKDLWRMGKATRVAFFELQSGYGYANALYESGRPNAANVVIREVTNDISADPMVAELKLLRLWEDAQKLLAKSEAASHNGIMPKVQWGLSPYSNQELEFVLRVSRPRSSSIVSVYPKLSGRKLLLERIVEARGQKGKRLDVFETKDRRGERARIEAHLKAGGIVFLNGLDGWTRELQADVFALLTAHPSWACRVYVMLSDPPESNRTLGPNLAAMLRGSAHRIEPLSDRLEDTLLLARGILARSVFPRPEDSKEAQRLIFTSQACAYIMDRYKAVGPLHGDMRAAGQLLDLDRDVIAIADGRLKISAEALERLLPSKSVAQPSTAAPSGALRWLGPSILKADYDSVCELYELFRGNLITLATVCGVPRTNITRAWKKHGVDKAWPGRQARA